MELMFLLFLLVLINLVIAMGRQEKRRWIRYAYNGASSVLLVVTFLLLLRCIK